MKPTETQGDLASARPHCSVVLRGWNGVAVGDLARRKVSRGRYTIVWFAQTPPGRIFAATFAAGVPPGGKKR